MVADDKSSMLALPTPLRDMSLALADMHKKEMPKQISVGWDVMTTCDGDKMLEAVALEGNTAHGWLFPRKGMPFQRDSWYTRKIQQYKAKFRQLATEQQNPKPL